MPRLALRAMPFALASIAALSVPGSAAAACTSTPTTASAADSAVDSGGLAPEATALNVAINGACVATLSYTVIDETSLLPSEYATWFLDTDGQAGSGATAGYIGADHALVRGASGPGLLTRYDPATASFVPLGPASPSGAFGIDVDLTQVSTYGTRAMTVAGGTAWKNSITGKSYFDFVPNPGLAPLPFSSTTTEAAPPAPPAAPPTPAPTPAPPATPAPTPQPAGPAPFQTPTDEPVDECESPVIRRMRLSDARAEIRVAGCKVGRIKRRPSKVIKAGRVIQGDKYPGELLPIGTRINLVVSTGKPARRLATADSPAAQSLDAVNAMADAQR